MWGQQNGCRRGTGTCQGQQGPECSMSRALKHGEEGGSSGRVARVAGPPEGKEARKGEGALGSPCRGHCRCCRAAGTGAEMGVAEVQQLLPSAPTLTTMRQSRQHPKPVTEDYRQFLDGENSANKRVTDQCHEQPGANEDEMPLRPASRQLSGRVWRHRSLAGKGALLLGAK